MRIFICQSEYVRLSERFHAEKDRINCISGNVQPLEIENFRYPYGYNINKLTPLLRNQYL